MRRGSHIEAATLGYQSPDGVKRDPHAGTGQHSVSPVEGGQHRWPETEQVGSVPNGRWFSVDVRAQPGWGKATQRTTQWGVRVQRVTIQRRGKQWRRELSYVQRGRSNKQIR